jgi:DNA-binding FrmR family transcriptional regulator
MIEDDTGYPDIVQQVSAVRAALDGVTQLYDISKEQNERIVGKNITLIQEYLF